MEKADLPTASQVTRMVEENATMLMNPKFLCNTVTNLFERRFCYWDLHTLSCCFFPICAINVSSLIFPLLSSTNDAPPDALTILRPLISIMLESMMSLSSGASDQTRKMKPTHQPKYRTPQKATGNGVTKYQRNIQEGVLY